MGRWSAMGWGARPDTLTGAAAVRLVRNLEVRRGPVPEPPLPAISPACLKRKDSVYIVDVT
ncbi:hypothetical protein GCM10010299_46120 [Streptomyces tanashiensis]|nr:hypothetical protein GCM10010299_46120 [Streptomyces tanashiensis]